MLYRITEEFFNTGISLNEFLKDATPEENAKYTTYYSRAKKSHPPDSLRIDLTRTVNLLVLGTTWCFDSQVYLPIIVLLAENNPKINIQIFNKDKYPFLAERVNNGEKVPQILLFSEDFYYISRWVERPTSVYQLVAELRKIHGWEKENFQTFLNEFRKHFLKQQKEFEINFITEIKQLLIRADWIQSAMPKQFT